ncbi:MptD family putative ECF transporter S component [uncultured Desulfosarcina sp.]|uniref:MptD family putative ECF transporter S component n=1 Tax=uncultured Desulfosarcina sp. TaxID=218289 RepID=UPI0029C817AE|nr:MptD family putative ECF transporter S component [uncultured Desulfosarcina sp.]
MKQANAPLPEGASIPRRYWEFRDLAVIGIFSALSKTASVMVALVGGGMNPLTLILKNMVFTTLLVVALFKVRKFGTLLLFTVVNTIFGALLMGGELVLLPPMLLAGLLAELVIASTGGYAKTLALMLGVAVYDLGYKAGALGLSWLFMREQPQLMWLMSVMVIIGYAGALAGLFVGARFVKELRHAGIVRH